MRIIAHRGASAAEPENTMAAFALAKRLGAHAVELDARVCGTGEVVVFHDRELDRLCGVPGIVDETPLARLRELKVMGRERIPLLEEVLRSDDRPPGLVIELKTDRWTETGLAYRVARLLRTTNAGAHGPITVSSFNPWTLRAMRGAARHVPRGMLAHRAGARPLRDLWLERMVKPREHHLEACLITPRRVARAHRSGRFVVAWTVNDPAEGKRLEEMGVDGLITDVPDRFAPPAEALANKLAN